MDSSEKLMILADQERTATVTVDKIPFSKLKKSSWSVNVTAISNEASDLKVPRASIHLHAKSPDSNEDEFNVLDFTEEELVKFYQVVEQIQEKLDEIYTKPVEL